VKTAIDTSVLVAVFNEEPDGRSWLDRLIQARREGLLVICDVVYAELAPAFEAEAHLQEALRKLGVSFESISPSSAWQAGQSFRRYRDAGGPHEHLVSDFLVAAHAQIQADRLATVDRGYLRGYFAGLPLLQV